VRYLLPILFLLPGCGARTGFSELSFATCEGDPPACIAPSQFCEAPRGVAPVCNVATKAYECPAGTKPHERVEKDGDVCLPFHEPGGPIESMSGSLVRVPLEDGRCLWIAEEARVRGKENRNVGIIADTDAPFGSCPKRAQFLNGEADDIVVVAAAERHLVTITGGYRIGGRTRVLYRMFRVDPAAPFGLENIGTGIANFDATNGLIIVPDSRELRFSPDLDLADASLVRGSHAFVWGCPGPPEFLTERCIVARLDSTDAMELFTGSNWVKSTRGSDGKTVFDSGPWVSSVTESGGTLRHVYAVGFGSDLQMHTASAPEGPWSAGRTIARCALPSGDEQAFCAGPVVHEELADPTRPGEMVVTYGASTLRAGERAPVDVWTRLVRIP